MENLRIAVLVDNPNSWIVPYAAALDWPLVHDHESIPEGDILFLLGCERILPAKYLQRNKSNVVIHPSPLPVGRGFSPLAWALLAGENSIHLTLFEAVEAVDEGDIYMVDQIILEGNELNEEVKRAQGIATQRLARKYVLRYPMQGVPQSGEASYYLRRTPADSRLDVNKTIAEQFNLLRVVDNDRYPAFFEHRGRRYELRINHVAQA